STTCPPSRRSSPSPTNGAPTAAWRPATCSRPPSRRPKHRPPSARLNAYPPGQPAPPTRTPDQYAVEEDLIEHSLAAHVRRPRVDYESHATGLDRNELGAILVAAGLGGPAEQR